MAENNNEIQNTKENTDIFLINSGIDNGTFERLVRELQKIKNKKENIFLSLVTYGGDPDAAFRIVSAIKYFYPNRFSLGIYGPCKSAGTLIAMGADRIIMGPFGEFGPLDVQTLKQDDFFSSSSGLDIFNSFSSIQEQSLLFFSKSFDRLLGDGGGRLSIKTALETATNLSVGLYSPLLSKLDPLAAGEMQRAINIAGHYGERIGKDNLNDGGLSKLVYGYPSHSFVIDMKEAKTIFKNVVDTPEEWELPIEEGLRKVVGMAYRVPQMPASSIVRLMPTLGVVEEKEDAANDAPARRGEPSPADDRAEHGGREAISGGPEREPDPASIENVG